MKEIQKKEEIHWHISRHRRLANSCFCVVGVMWCLHQFHICHLFTKENCSLVSFRKFILLVWQPPTEKSQKCHISPFLSISNNTKGSKLKFNKSKVSKFVYFTFRSHAINLLSFTSQKVHSFVGRYGICVICVFCFYLFVKLILKVLNWWRIDPMLGGIYSSPENNMF